MALSRIIFIAMIGLMMWVGTTAIRIECLNAKAGYYMPRHDDDGTWRISMQNTPRDRLSRLVEGAGFLQYVLAPLLIGLAVVSGFRSKSAFQSCLAASSGIVGLAALGFALYRGYFSSLGW